MNFIKIEVGMTIKTSYGTGPYIVESISSVCNCPPPLSEIETDEPIVSKDHFHYSLIDEEGKGGFGLNGYDIEGKSVWSSDFLIIEKFNNAQTSLF